MTVFENPPYTNLRTKGKWLILDLTEMLLCTALVEVHFRKWKSSKHRYSEAIYCARFMANFMPSPSLSSSVVDEKNFEALKRIFLHFHTQQQTRELKTNIVETYSITTHWCKKANTSIIYQKFSCIAIAAKTPLQFLALTHMKNQIS